MDVQACGKQARRIKRRRAVGGGECPWIEDKEETKT